MTTRVGVAMLLLAVAACVVPNPRPDARPPADLPEPWVFRSDGREWILGNYSANELRVIREYVVPPETVETWTELVTSTYDAVDVSPRDLFAQFKTQMSLSCPPLYVSVLEESQDSILFEWRHDGCQGFPAQHEIHRFARARSGILSLAYVQKTPQLPDATRASWVAILSAATIRPGY